MINLSIDIGEAESDFNQEVIVKQPKGFLGVLLYFQGELGFLFYII